MTSPKMVWRIFRCGVGATVMKNCEPLVPGPAFWAAHAGAGWVAALDHESRDDAVEDGAVVEWPFVRASGVLLGVWRGALCEGDKVFDSFWCMVAEQFDFNVTKVGVQDCSCSLETHDAHLKARQAKYR